MVLNIEKLKEIYGETVLYDIKENLDSIIANINYLLSKKFKDIFDIFETYPYLFMNTPEVFQKKVDSLIEKLGVEYIEKLEHNYSLWGEVNDKLK